MKNPLRENPLTENRDLPPFDAIKSEHIVPAVSALIEASEVSLETLLKDKANFTWDGLVAQTEELEDRISKAWSPVSHLNSVMNEDSLREAYEAGQQKLTDYYVSLGQNDALFDAYKAISESEEYSDFPQPKKKAIDNALRDFELSGIALSSEKKARFKEIKARLSTLSSLFSNNVLDATSGWYKHLEDEQRLAGLPEFLVEGAKAAAETKDLDGYVLTLDLPVYFTLMSQAEDRDLRKEMYLAYCTRASAEGPTGGQWDNTGVIEEILALKQEQAVLLGYANYAEVSTASKMAESPEMVIEFLQQLADKTRPFAEAELAELRDFASEAGVLGETKDDETALEAWDVPYLSEKLKLAKYAISQEQLRPYFPIDVVRQGLFRVAKTLYNIDINRVQDVELWHEAAEYYEITRDGKKVAGFYLDLYARERKRGGAWMADCRTRRQGKQGLQLPVAFLVCNFNAPVGDKPSLLTHDEVTTLFHEFGHGLHHMLTKVDVAAVSGIGGVEWDAVELPSQFMENFCWQEEVLGFLSSHFESGEVLPSELLANLLAAKNFQSALQMLRQLEFAIFDMRLHMAYGSKNFPGVQALLDEVREQVAVLTPPRINKFQNGFSHIFAGGYAAGYYSYKWAEVLSADAFSAFEEEGIFNPETGKRFLESILEKGGSQDAMSLFINFRGRKPNEAALLKHSGLVANV